MASVAGSSLRVSWWLKVGLFVAIGAVFVPVLWVDDRFWFLPADPRWHHFQPLLRQVIVHGLLGFTALVTGTLQMSGRIRRNRPALHRTLGTVYVVAVVLSAPLAILIGTSAMETPAIHVEQVFQGGLWLCCALIAYVAARRRLMVLHRDWMIRSYGLTLVFVTSRIPDVIWGQTTDQFAADFLWSLVVIALLAPDVITATAGLWRAGRAR